MNLSQLRFASALATTQSFTSAAAQCFVTQPTLSNGIAQLENELGERLFVRTTRKVALTPLGTHLLPYVNEVLNAQVALIQQTHAFLSPHKQLVRIGTSPLVSAGLLNLMIEPFCQRNPNIEIVLREMNMADLHRMLEQGLLDFALGVAGSRKASLTTTFLYEEPLLFISRGGAAKPTPAPRPVQIRDIANETYVMVPDSCGLANATRSLFRSQRRKLHEYSGEAMSYQVLQEWAALGIGAAILPKSKVVDSARAIAPIVDKSGASVMITFEASWSRTRKRAPHVMEFTDHLRRVAPQIAGGLQT
jgi:DNA-binding transcriptional LysR family regulator